MDALMTTLITAVEDCNMNVEREAAEEVRIEVMHVMYVDIMPMVHLHTPLKQRERLSRESMIAEQNRAYEESLHADREKVQYVRCGVQYSCTCTSCV